MVLDKPEGVFISVGIRIFASVFTSFMWLIYMILYLRDKVGSAGFNTLGLLDIALYVALLILPICVLWMIFGYVYQYLTFQKTKSQYAFAVSADEKNQDYTDLVARVLLEMEQELKDGFILNKFELFIADMNELLAETIQRGALASPDQIDRLWAKSTQWRQVGFRKKSSSRLTPIKTALVTVWSAKRRRTVS